MVGLIPRWIPPVVVRLIALALVTSLVAAIGARAGLDLYGVLALVPAEVAGGQVWRLVTWPFAEPGALGLVLHTVAYYYFGVALVSRWGAGRFTRFVVLVIATAGVGTLLLALVLPTGRWIPHLGGLALADALCIAWALAFPERRLQVYGLLSIGGPTLAYGTLAVTALFALYYGVEIVAPELIAALTALSYMTGGHRDLWRQLTRLRPRRRGGDVVRGPFGPN